MAIIAICDKCGKEIQKLYHELNRDGELIIETDDLSDNCKIIQSELYKKDKDSDFYIITLCNSCFQDFLKLKVRKI